MARQWQPLVDQLSDVGKLVHLAARKEPLDVDRVRSELLRERRRYYEAELTAQAARVGCPGRSGNLSNGAILSELNQKSMEDATSIVNTYNYDLAVAIRYIRAETPTANRFTYAKRLGEWETRRGAWKNDQIALYTETSARAKAQADFYQYHANFGTAELVPKTAVCPVCRGWVARGEVPLRTAMNHPGPFHVGCPHTWETHPERVAREDCPMLWMGQG